MKLTQITKIAAGITLAVSFGHAMAAVSADEAKQLGSNLTAFGAEMGGSGDIPAYTGGAKVPASFKAGSNVRPNPYADQKPKYTITQANMAQYEGKLTMAAKELLKRYKDFRMDVYPTERSVNYPDAILNNIKKNATNAKTTNDGLVLEGALAGTPFPIPKTGYEVMWNHLVRYTGLSFTLKYDSVNVDSSGNSTLATTGVITQEYPIYSSKNLANPLKANDVFFQTRVEYLAPARRVGEALLLKDFVDPITNTRRGWQYLPGQRRVKEAPEIAYDTPNAGTAGNSTYDDAFIYNGAMDRYDMKLVGKKEMIVPYNTYAWAYDTGEKMIDTPKFANPDLIRWELHRVWVVEATLKPGKRHIYAKRTFYVDEDSWTALASDMYDARGELYRGGFFSLAPAYDQKAPNGVGQVFYDFNTGAYSISAKNTGKYGGIKFNADVLPANDWAPNSLVGSGIR